MRRSLLAFVVASLGGAMFAVACGAENLEAPAAVQPADVGQCRGFDQLMPNFVQAIDQGRTQNLKKVVEEQLLKPLRQGDAPPVNDVLRSIFNTLTRFAEEPPEAGASSGQLCATGANLPGLGKGNDLCELRRALQVLVHDGKGVDAVKLFDPQFEILLNYLTGQGLTCDGKPRVAHYEVSGLFSAMCGQTQQCNLSNGLDLVAGFSDYLYTPDGKALVQHLNVLATKSSVLDLLNPQALSEADTVTLAKALIPMIRAANAADLENAFSRLPLPDQVKTDLRPLVDDLKKILVHPELIGPVNTALGCFIAVDKNYDIVRMVYRVAIAEKCPEFGLTRLTEVATGLQSVDTRGSLVYVAGAVAKAVRADETAIDSGALVCKTFFSTSTSVGEARSNAELVLPVVTDLVKNGIINEGICAADTLVFGCAGGEQPACR